ncbi:permease prefix domain 1-containing protein [Paenibacillus sinopodophylli]|uniref:permease prefix domain 1-containing protein n=1 Tax=Paenibacillus sinopodophylli TaxID=1837342 RepID=UPI001FE33FBD|nr:permease prefix domain 1-containing protein [Paenibacillus sinopodophylli]
MKEIEAFVDSVYQNTGGNKKEIKELQAEMRSHLLEAVHELKNEGKSEQEAVQLAIERFGGEQEMRAEISQLYHKQKLFAKGLLFAAITVLIVVIFSFQFLYQRDYLSSNDFPHRFNEKIIDSLQDHESMTEEVKKEVESIVQSNKRVNKIEIYNTKGIEGNELLNYLDNSKPLYSYSEDVNTPRWLWAGYYQGGNGMGNWFVYTSAFGYYVVSILILVVGIALYWALFTIWAIVYAFHTTKKASVVWMLIFLFFNIIGFVGFLLINKNLFKRIQA